MKKALLFIAVVALATSCKKNRTCTCNYVESGPSPDNYTTNYTVKDTKKHAKTWCEGFNSSGSYGGGYSWSKTCTLK